MEGDISVWLYHSIKRYIRFLPFSWPLNFSWELKVHYIFYLLDGVFKFVPRSLYKVPYRKKILKKVCDSLISLPLLTIIPPIFAFSTLCLPHNYSILPPTINLVRESVVSFSLQMYYGNTKSLTTLEILCKQHYYWVIADFILPCWKQFAKLLRSYNFSKFLENRLC